MINFCAIEGCANASRALGFCSKHYQAARYAEKMRPYHEARYLKKRATILATNAAWRQANPQKLEAIRVAYAEESKARGKAWAEAHPERRREIANQWVRNNPAKANAGTARRRAKQLLATPRWANRFFIDEIYHLAELRTKATGYRWEVDHIVPLRSDVVCGLHVEHNLRVIPKSINASKGNRSWPDMPT